MVSKLDFRGRWCSARDAFRHAFYGFDPEKVARLDENDVLRLLGDTGIIRSKIKIMSAINNAQAYIRMQEAGEDFSKWVWNFVGGAPIQSSWKKQSDVPAQIPLASEISKELRGRGFKFVGPTMIYAWMQAVGLVNDHVVECFRHEEVRALGSLPPG